MAELPEDYCFPSDAIYPQLDIVRENFRHLNRWYPDEQLFKIFVELVVAHTMVSYDGLISLSDQVRHCEQHGVEGAYLDVGSWKGGCSGIMALANRNLGKTSRDIHVFDSFKGMPEPIEGYDIDLPSDWLPWLTEERWQGKLEPTNILNEAKRGDVERLVLDIVGHPRDKLHIHEGWFQETIPAVAPAVGPIAILRLDGDFYESTRIALEHLFPHVVKGGFVILDDWSFPGARRACNEYFARHGLVYYPVHVDKNVHYFIK